MNPNFEKDGFLFFRGTPTAETKGGESRLIVQSARLTETIAYIKKNRITNIQIQTSYYRENSLSFLKEICFLKGVYVLEGRFDLSSVNVLTDLETLIMNSSTKEVDFSNFPNLKEASFDYKKNAINIQNCSKLRWLWIDGFTEDDLSIFRNLNSLEYLHLFKTNIRTLRGIENLTLLKTIHLDTARKLETLTGLTRNLKHMTKLDIWLAPLLTDYQAIGHLTNLKQLELRRTGDINSINVLDNLEFLEKVTLGLKVIDGNMKYLKKIPNVGYIDYPHYDLKLKQLKA